jgi:hypothetical protein
MCINICPKQVHTASSARGLYSATDNTTCNCKTRQVHTVLQCCRLQHNLATHLILTTPTLPYWRWQEERFPQLHRQTQHSDLAVGFSFGGSSTQSFDEDTQSECKVPLIHNLDIRCQQSVPSPSHFTSVPTKQDARRSPKLARTINRIINLSCPVSNLTTASRLPSPLPSHYLGCTVQ